MAELTQLQKYQLLREETKARIVALRDPLSGPDEFSRRAEVHTQVMGDLDLSKHVELIRAHTSVDTLHRLLVSLHTAINREAKQPSPSSPPKAEFKTEVKPAPAVEDERDATEIRFSLLEFD